MWKRSEPGRSERVLLRAVVGVLLLLAATRVAADAQVQASRGPVVPFPPALPLGLRTPPPDPADNPLTREKAELGARLFFDPILSRDRTVSCASCHQPEAAFGDSEPVSNGILGRKGARNSPTLVNRVYGRSFFWDGRAATLEQAVLMPVQDTMEMAMTATDVVARLERDRSYATLFRTAFPEENLSQVTLARALASYVRTLRSGDSPADRFAAGDSTALSGSAQRGRTLFFGRADCSDCHRGSNFTDEGFHNLGVSTTDAGRFAVTGNERDRGSFKTPTLRDVALTAPYMHDGSLATLEAVVDFYDRGGGPGANGGFARRGGGRGGRGGRGRIRPLGLSGDEKADLVAFLRALTSRPPAAMAFH